MSASVEVNGMTFTFKNGFPEIIRCKLSDWIGERCEACSGADWDGPASACRACSGTGRVGGHGPAIVQAAPVLRVEAVGMRPIVLECDAGRVWNWMSGVPEAESPWFLPADIQAALSLPFSLVGGEAMNARYAHTEAAALDALSLCLVNHARRTVRQQHGGEGWADLTMEDCNR